MNESTLFESTANYYDKFRQPYPQSVIDFLISELGLDQKRPILDLGCGTGQLSIPLATAGISCYAVDPSSEMLAAGIGATDASSGAKIWWGLGSDKTITQADLPSLQACIMGASFHWMDRARLVSDLDPLIAKGGALAVLGGAIETWSEKTNARSGIIKSTVQEFMGEERRAGNGTYAHPKAKHQDVLKETAFCEVTMHSFDEQTRVTVDEIVGLQLSTSYASPRLLGARVDEFQTVLADRLNEIAVGGFFEFERTHEVIVAKRK